MHSIDYSCNITADKLQGPLKGKGISDLVSISDKSAAYVNIHTETYPDGEIRGQISEELLR